MFARTDVSVTVCLAGQSTSKAPGTGFPCPRRRMLKAGVVAGAGPAARRCHRDRMPRVAPPTFACDLCPLRAARAQLALRGCGLPSACQAAGQVGGSGPATAVPVTGKEPAFPEAPGFMAMPGSGRSGDHEAAGAPGPPWTGPAPCGRGRLRVHELSASPPGRRGPDPRAAAACPWCRAVSCERLRLGVQ